MRTCCWALFTFWEQTKTVLSDGTMRDRFRGLLVRSSSININLQPDVHTTPNIHEKPPSNPRPVDISQSSQNKCSKFIHNSRTNRISPIKDAISIKDAVL